MRAGPNCANKVTAPTRRGTRSEEDDEGAALDGVTDCHSQDATARGDAIEFLMNVDEHSNFKRAFIFCVH